MLSYNTSEKAGLQPQNDAVINQNMRVLVPIQNSIRCDHKRF